MLPDADDPTAMAADSRATQRAAQPQCRQRGGHRRDHQRGDQRPRWGRTRLGRLILTTTLPDGAYGRNNDGSADQNMRSVAWASASTGAADDSMVTLKSSLDPNSTAYAADTAGSGSTISAATDEVTENAASVEVEDWDHKVLFRDWGDTAGTGDGGYETGALIYSNIEDATEHPFDRKLADRYVNIGRARACSDLTILANGGAPGVTTLATSVSINAGRHSGGQHAVGEHGVR